MTIYTPNQENLGRRRFPDNKGFRKELYNSSLSFLSQTQDLLPSNYPKDFSTNLAVFNRVMARELARLKWSNDAISNDKEYTETRIKYLHQILGERLFLGDNNAPTNYNSETYRDFLVSIKNAYLLGSKKLYIEALASKFTGQRILIKELYLEAREPYSSLDVTSTHKMIVNVFIDDFLRAGYNINTLQRDLDFFINITRPAHVLYDTRLIWTEQIDVNKIYDLIFGDTGGGCIPYYIYTPFEEPTILALQVFILPDSEGATGQIDSIHHADLIFYLSDSTRVITEPGLIGTKIYDEDGRQVTFNKLEIGQFVRITPQEIPGTFNFWWYPSQILSTWTSQFYRDVYRRPIFQEFVKKEMDSNGRFPLQIKTTPTTVCDRWVQDALQPLYEDLRGTCTSGGEYSTQYSVTLNKRQNSPHLSWPYDRNAIHDSILFGSDFVYWMTPTPLTDGSSGPALPSDITIQLDGTALPSPIMSVDASSGRINLYDTTTYWDQTAGLYPIPGNELVFSYHYLQDNTNYDASSSIIYGITYWQMPKVPVTNGDGMGVLAIPDDITLSVDGTTISNAVLNISPFLGHVALEQIADFWVSSELNRTPHLGDIFEFDYYWGKRFQYSILSDDTGRTLDTWVGPYNTGFVLDGTTGINLETTPLPELSVLEIGYRYRAYLLHHSSVLNSPDTLRLNDFQKPVKRASIINQEETLNHFNKVFSPEFLYDTSKIDALDDRYLENGLDPILKLREGVPPFQKTFSYQTGFIESRKLQDLRKNHELLLYSDLLLKEFTNSGESVPLSTICDADSVTFKTSLGSDTLIPLQECPPWIIYDTIDMDNVEINIPGEYRGIPNLRVFDKLLRGSFILREIEPTGTALYTYTVYTPFSQKPPTEFNLPSSFEIIYNEDPINFPALPIVDEFGSLATMADIELKVNDIPWTITGLDPITGSIQIAEYPEANVVIEHVITVQEAAAHQFILPGWPTDPIKIVLTPIGGTAQYYGEDFLVDGQCVLWFGNLKKIIGAGDRIRILYLPYMRTKFEFTYRIRSFAYLSVINTYNSRIMDNGYYLPGICPDGPVMKIEATFNEYPLNLDDYSDGIKISFFNKNTLQIEEHVFSGPVFEYYNKIDDELGHPDNFPNALIKLKRPISTDNPLNYITDYNFMNDKVIRFRKKTYKELLPSRTFKTLEVVEMLSA